MQNACGIYHSISSFRKVEQNCLKKRKDQLSHTHSLITNPHELQAIQQ